MADTGYNLKSWRRIYLKTFSITSKSICCKRKGDAPHKVGNTIGDNDDDADDDDGGGDLDDD